MRLHTLDEAAELLQVSRSTLRRLINAGDIARTDVAVEGEKPNSRISEPELWRFIEVRTKRIKSTAK